MRQVGFRDEVVGPIALDRQCRRLLFRAQRAIASILGSEAYATDLRTAIEEQVLRRHEWEIAVALRDITELRVAHAWNAGMGKHSPMTTTVLASHQRAMTLADEAITSRISALEHCAAQFGAADAAQHDWQLAVRMSGFNDKYLDLVARTAADEHAVAEITGLSEQANIAARAFHETVQRASLAAEALVLPQPRAG